MLQEATCTVDRESGLFAFDERPAAVDAVHAQTAIYTAAVVVDPLLRRLGWPNGESRLLDPSCGDGAFLLSALEALALMPDDVDNALRVRGCEIHPGAVADCRERVEAFLVEGGWSRPVAVETVAEMVIERDFLTEDLGMGLFDVIAGNPPYLRYANLPEFFKDLYSMTVEDYARGDMLHMFLARCCAMLPAGGVIGLVTSDRWIGNMTAANLRGRLGEMVGVDHLARLSCETAFYRPKRRVKGSLPRIHPIEVVLRPRGDARWQLSEAPISPDEVGQEAYTGKTLGDICSVRIAPWLGPEGAFVVDKARASTLAGADLVPAVDTDDIDPGTSALSDPTRYAIRTRREAEPTGALAAHLRAWEARMPKRKGNRPYWMPPETITLTLDQPSLLVPRISRTLRSARLPAGVLGINHNLSIVSSGPEHTLDMIEEILKAERSQEWIRRHAPRLEGGFYSITTTLLRRLPVE